MFPDSSLNHNGKTMFAHSMYMPHVGFCAKKIGVRENLAPIQRIFDLSVAYVIGINDGTEHCGDQTQQQIDPKGFDLDDVQQFIRTPSKAGAENEVVQEVQKQIFLHGDEFTYCVQSPHKQEQDRSQKGGDSCKQKELNKRRRGKIVLLAIEVVGIQQCRQPVPKNTDEPAQKDAHLEEFFHDGNSLSESAN
jgi:hypothetical protein